MASGQNRWSGRRKSSNGRWRSSGASGQDKASKGLRRLPVAVALIVILGIAYFASAGAVGKWMADRVIAPLLGWTGSATRLPQNSGYLVAPQSATPAPQATNLPAQSVMLSSYACHALQMGAFDGAVNAEAEAVGVRQSGGAGFVWQDGMYRVLAAGYLSQADAEKVKEQLQQGATESVIYTYQAPPIKLDVFATDQQVDCLKQTFAVIEKIIADVEALSMDLDMGKTQPANAKDSLRQYSQNMAAAMLKMREQFAGSEDVQIIAALMGVGSQTEQLLAQGAQDVGEENLPVWLKSTRLELALKYIQMRKGLI